MLRGTRKKGHLAAGAWLLAALALSLFAGSARAQTQTTPTPRPFCSASPTDSLVLTCSFVTAAAVAPGGTLVLSLTSPSGATITNVTGLPGGCTISGTAATGLFQPTVMVACDFTSGGISTGTEITETVALPVATSTLTESVTYNASAFGAIATGTPPTTTSGTCVPGPTPTTFDCTNTTGAATASGGTLALTITAAPDQTLTVTGPCGPSSVPCFAGTCPIANALTATSTTTPPSPPLSTASAPGSILTITYTCSSGETVPAGTTISVLVTSGGGVSSAGSCTPASPVTIPPTFSCSNTPAAAVVSGGVLTLTITAAAGQQISIAGPCGTTTAPCTAGSCPLTTPLPTSTTTTVTLTYACGPGQSAPAGTAIAVAVTNASATTPGACTPPAVPPGGTTTCTNTPIVTTGPGGTLTISVGVPAGATGSLQITGAAPSVTGCSLQTPIPTTSGASASVTYLCPAGASIPAGTPIQVTVQNSASAASPTTSTTAGSCSAYPAAAPFTSTCTNTPGQVTVGGGTLALTITAPGPNTIDGFAPGSPPAFAGTCPNTATTPIPATAVTITYTCTGTEMALQAPVPIMVTVTSITGPAGATPTESTVSTNPPAPTTGLAPVETTVANANGGSGAPSELTSVNEPGVVSGVAPTTEATTANANGAVPGVPGPTTQTIIFAICIPPTGSATTTMAECGQTPTVTLKASTQDTDVGQLVTFTATATTINSNATINGFSFNFGDGYPPVSAAPVSSDATASVTVTHTFPTNGLFQVTATATDSTGQTGTSSILVGVRRTVSYLGLYQPPPPGVASAGTSMSVTLTAVPDSVLPGQPVTFVYAAATQVNEAAAYGYTQPSTNASSSPASLKLDFGDGSPPQLVQPNKTATHIYTSPGGYTATLTATDNLGNVGYATAPETVRSPVVQPPSMVAFDLAPTDGTTGTPLTFEAGTAQTTAYCGAIKSYSFDFGDGTPPVTLPNGGQVATHVYSQAGTYTVTLTVTGCDGGTATATATVTISDGGQ